MLSLSKTRWLSLFPARHWEDDTDVSSFEGTLSVSAEATHSDQEVLYLWHMHSLLSVFHTHIQEMEKEDNSILELKRILNSTNTILLDHKSNNFMSLKVKGLLAQKRRDVLGKGCDQFCADVQGLYSACLEYLEKWMTPMEEFSTFMWTDLSEPNI